MVDQLLLREDLDAYVGTQSGLAHDLEGVLQMAMTSAYGDAMGPDADRAHLFLQRILYKINRLQLFWYDDLANYRNERSLFLMKIRNDIETRWQRWETDKWDLDGYTEMSCEAIKDKLRERMQEDLDPPLSPNAIYMREVMTREGYIHLLAIASLDGLVEASRQSRICGGAANEIMCAIFRVLMEEYGTGRFNKKHSTFFAQMMNEFGMELKPEAYLELVPWQVLASINHNFLLTDRKVHYLRYNGGLTFFEVNGPSVYRTYAAAARRLGLSDAALGYWDLHVKEDERHGRWMVEDVAVPLVDKYPQEGWQVLWGYDQEKAMGERAGAAVVAEIQRGERERKTVV